MQTKHTDIFITIQTEGALLPADLLKRIADGDSSLEGLRPEDYHLFKGEKLNEAINRSWNRLLGAWTSFKTAIDKIDQGDPGTTVTRERWLLPLFQELGYGRLLTARSEEINGKSYPISHAWNHVPIHLVGFRIDLDKRTAGVAGAAKTSPHSIVQELLNRSSNHLWALVSNGLRLRILRDNTSLTRQAFVQFDLEAMMSGELYADFVLLWLLCHQSRVEAEKLEDFWLEKWSRTAQQQGTRALETLRDGVQQAIEALGRGFLKHPGNRPLRDKLRSGALGEQDYYRQLLRLVYRLLFLFAAEDRDLLFDPHATQETQTRYLKYYSTRRLRDLAQRRRGTRHSDLFHGLRLVMRLLGEDEGSSVLGLPALGSFLFANGEQGTIPDIEGCEISNHDLLDAVRELAFTVDGNVLRAVDYRNMGSEELGSVYEALLELHPQLNVDAGTFTLSIVSGSERKTTGSYYTPTSLINALLDSALDPVLEEAARKPNPYEAILDLKICDPACGSGHFLIAAAHRVAKRLASIETGDDEPGPAAVRSALRKVIGRCIYGADLNPMAVELCKVSLWMEALEPGKALSFLDHHIQVGNSLLGTTPVLLAQGIPDQAFEPIEGDDKRVCSEYKKRNKDERKGQERLFGHDLQPWEQLGNLVQGMINLDEMDDSSLSDVRRKQQRYEDLIRSQDYLYSTFLADSWCAAFVWKKNQEFPYPITEQVFRKIERNPFDIAPWMKEEIQRLAEQYQFFHWHLRFPDVFHLPHFDEHAENEHTGWIGGFDVILGNPPWEMVELSEKEFFSSRAPEIATATTARLRQQLIVKLSAEQPELFQVFSSTKRQIYGYRHFIQHSGKFPLSSTGRINLYPIFVELATIVITTEGRSGLIVPSAVAMDAYNAPLFSSIVNNQQLVSLFDFENRDAIFEQVHRSYRFCLITLSKTSTLHCVFCYFCHDITELAKPERRIILSHDEIAIFSPNTLAPPILLNAIDMRLARAAYIQFGVLLNRSYFPPRNPWQVSIQRMLSLSDPGDLFRKATELESEIKTNQNNSWERLYSGKAIHQFNHRFAKWDEVKWRNFTTAELTDPTTSTITEYYVRSSEIPKRVADKISSTWLLVYRDVCRATDERTAIAAIVPLVGCDTTCRNIYSTIQPSTLLLCLLGNINSIIFDYFVRQKVIGIHLNAGVFEQLPILPPEMFLKRCIWQLDKIILSWITARNLELTYTAWDLEPFARDCDYDGPPFHWDEERRFLLRCELDAAYFHLYGIVREDVDYIMDTFPIVRRKDEARYGEYRTKRVILQIYDAMRRAIDTGEPYQTLLDPPPADPRVAHLPQDGQEALPGSSNHVVPVDLLQPPQIEPTPTDSINRSTSDISVTDRTPSTAARTRRPVEKHKPTPAYIREATQTYDTESLSNSLQPLPAASNIQQSDVEALQQTLDGIESATLSQENSFHVGDNVWHNRFGDGQIIAIVGQGIEQLLTVQFKTTGTKKLMASMANLEKR